jgi:mRNA-degrading endonuclease toxin of MazEF toxin-antitoxin module
MNASDLKPGDIVWVEMGNTVGHEQAHTRPWLILSSHTRLHLVRGLDLVIGVPLTSKHHHGAAFANARF